MSDGQSRKTGKLGTGPLNSPQNNANQIYHHQRRAEALAAYAPEVVPLLKNLVLNTFGSTPGYGVDDNIDADSEIMRYGWRIFGLSKGEAKFKDDTPAASQRKTLLAVELLFGETGLPVNFLVDTRRTHTTFKTGLLGLKQKVTTTYGSSRTVRLDSAELAEALEDLAQTMEK